MYKIFRTRFWPFVKTEKRAESSARALKPKLNADQMFWYSIAYRCVNMTHFDSSAANCAACHRLGIWQVMLQHTKENKFDLTSFIFSSSIFKYIEYFMPIVTSVWLSIGGACNLHNYAITVMSGILHSATSMADSSIGEQMNVSRYKIQRIKIMRQHYYGPSDIFRTLS